MDREELGALWSRKTKEGEEYFSGTIKQNDQVLEIVVFRNKYKKADNHPDYRILRSEKKNVEMITGTGNNWNATSTGNASDDPNPEDIPF